MNTSQKLNAAKSALGLAIAFVYAAGPVEANAGAIIAPVSGVINIGGPGFGSIADTINQGGLTAGYTAGVTDFDTYLASGPRHSEIFSGFEWFGEIGAISLRVTYDLGAATTIDALALWNEESSGIGTLTLSGSTDNVTFTPFATDLHPSDNPLTLNTGLGTYAADVFGFSAVSTRYVRFDISDIPQDDPGSFPSGAIGEVAFRVGPQIVQHGVPDAGSTLGMLGGAIALVGAFGRRIRR